MRFGVDTLEINGNVFPVEYNLATDTHDILVFAITAEKADGRKEKQKIVIPENHPAYLQALEAYTLARAAKKADAAADAAEAKKAEEREARKAARAERKAKREAEKAAAAADPAAPAKAPKEYAGEVIQGKGWKIYFNPELEKTQVIFDSFPTKEARETVKAAGFWWNSYTGSWNKKLTNKARRAALQLAKDLETLKKITA